ncbi:MAG: hypothetical protein WBV22_07470 [Anaerolineaceae bacterium]
MKRYSMVIIIVCMATALLFAVPIIPSKAIQPVISGYVFAGGVGVETTPVAGVTLELRGSDTINDSTGILLDTAVTDSFGSYELEVTSELYNYLNVIEYDLDHYVTVGASSVNGTVRNSNWIQYTTPLGVKDLTGNKFWDAPPAYTFEGRVFRGEVGEETNPLSGVTVSLHLSNSGYPSLGALVDTAVSDINGWYSLSTSTDIDYYQIVQTDLTGFSSKGATSVGGTVRSSNVIEYTSSLSGKTLTGNKFWDDMPIISGYVFAGGIGVETTPITGVTLRLYGSNSPDVMYGVLLASTVTDINGRYGLDVTNGLYSYLNVIEYDLGHFVSVGASSVNGTVRNSNWIQYTTPLGVKDLTGNKFWDQSSTPLYNFEGRVFRGEIGNDAIPLSGVTVSLRLSNSGYPNQGALVDTAVSDINGWYSLSTSTDIDYYQIVQTDLTGFSSKGATSVGGTVRSSNVIEYTSSLSGKTLTGNKFWDDLPFRVFLPLSLK